MEIFQIAAWELWKMRNRLVFDGVQASLSRSLQNFKEEASLQSIRIKDVDISVVLNWINSL
jgi:hypothetical protein